MGLSFHDVAAIRSVLAVPGFALLAWLYRSKTTAEWDATSRRNDLLLALFAGFLCYYPVSYTHLTLPTICSV